MTEERVTDIRVQKEYDFSLFVVSNYVLVCFIKLEQKVIEDGVGVSLSVTCLNRDEGEKFYIERR